MASSLTRIMSSPKVNIDRGRLPASVISPAPPCSNHGDLTKTPFYPWQFYYHRVHTLQNDDGMPLTGGLGIDAKAFARRHAPVDARDVGSVLTGQTYP